MKKINIYEIMKDLSMERKIFHSEADFQFSLAWLIKKNYGDKVDVRLEVPLSKDTKDRLDILVLIDERSIPIELKYFHSEVKYKEYNLSQQNDTWRSYDFIKDIKRVEEYVIENNDLENREGYTILICNESKYWNKHNKNYIYSQFSLYDGRHISENSKLDWREVTSSTMNKGDSLTLKNEYNFNWKNYSKINIDKKNIFKYLVCEYTED